MDSKPDRAEIDEHTIKLIVGLIAFGVAWLSASRILPLITSTDERLSLSPFSDQEA